MVGHFEWSGMLGVNGGREAKRFRAWKERCGALRGEGKPTCGSRGQAGKIGSSFERYIATFKMIEKVCFVKVVFIWGNIGIGRRGVMMCAAGEVYRKF